MYIHIYIYIYIYMVNSQENGTIRPPGVPEGSNFKICLFMIYVLGLKRGLWGGGNSKIWYTNIKKLLRYDNEQFQCSKSV